MIFRESKEMKISVLKEQEGQLSSKEGIREACCRADVVAFDIYDGEKLAGFAMLRKYEEDGWFLWDYAIAHDCQNRHIGTKALKELIGLMRERYGMREMSTTYIYGNEHAKHVYERVGFAETDVVDEPGCHEVNMIYRAG